MYYKI